MVAKSARARKVKTPQANVVDLTYLDEIAENVADGDTDLDNLKLDDKERTYVESKIEWLVRQKVVRKRRRNVRTERRAKLFPGAVTPAEFAQEAGAEIYKLVIARYFTDTPIDMHVLVIPRWLYRITSNHNEQRLLAQLVFWFSPDMRGKIRARVHRDGYFWVAKTDEDMYLETDVGVRTLKRARAALVNRGILVTQKWNFDATKMTHYRIDWQKFEDAYLDGAGDLRNLKRKKGPGVVHDADPEEVSDDVKREVKHREKRFDERAGERRESEKSKRWWEQEKRKKARLAG